MWCRHNLRNAGNPQKLEEETNKFSTRDTDGSKMLYTPVKPSEKILRYRTENTSFGFLATKVVLIYLNPWKSYTRRWWRMDRDLTVSNLPLTESTPAEGM